MPGLLLGRAPPARGTPLLVVKGRASPLLLWNGLPTPDRAEEAGRSKLERLGLGRLELGRLVRGRSEYDRGALLRPEGGRLNVGRSDS